MPAHAFLKDFQAATVNQACARFFDPENPAHRFLVADEVGLGKTLVARGIVERFLERYSQAGRSELRVVYICSNQSIATQNIDRLVGRERAGASKSVGRINLLALKGEKRDPDFGKTSEGPCLQITALSPKTSFEVKRGGGIAQERAILYHLVRGHSGFTESGGRLRQFFQLDVGPDRWRELIAEHKDALDPGVTELFHAALDQDPELRKELTDHCETRFSQDTARIRRLSIGKLRRRLASVCVKFLKPDLIILDEFQRFKKLIDQDEDSEIRLITDSLFLNEEIKTLLLSATPYKMYTLRSEEEAGESHYEEFRFVTRFLLGNGPEHTEFLRDWESYSSALLRMHSGDWDSIMRCKARVEQALRNVIARTERITVSDDRNTMLRPMGTKTLVLRPDDIRAFVATDAIARELSGYFEHIQSPVEYCKSAAFPFSFLDGYHLARKIQESIKKKKGDTVRLLRNARTGGLLPFRKMEDYRKFDFPNPKLRHLLDLMIEKGGADLLWVPSSLPYYPAEGPFSGQETFTKTLVFSSWMMVPKMIASTVSYECERMTIGSQESIDATQERSPRKYFTTGSERHPRPRLRPRIDSGQFVSIPQYALLYPSLRLSRLWDPFAGWPASQGLNGLLARLAKQISELLSEAKLSAWIGDPSRKEDDRWIPILMILLDRNGYGDELRRIGKASREQKKTLFGTDEDATIARQYFEKILERIAFAEDEEAFAKEILELELGPLPADHHEILAYLSVASPAVCAHRTLDAHFDSKTSGREQSFFGAYRIADQFRKFLNVPETIAVIDKYAIFDVYWKNAVRYFACGNFQSMLDEYAATLVDRESLWDLNPAGKVSALSDHLSKDIGLRTVTVTAQSFGSIANGKAPKHLRCHFAVSLNHTKESESDVVRSDNVREAFNSPFRPFVLATTSIGQEGLDFHQYCRRIFHWNLPANPVDFEQREGRINRFKNLAIRQNIARKYRSTVRPSRSSDVWSALYQEAITAEKGDKTDLVPYWHVEPENIFIERQAPALPYSKEAARYPALLRTLAVYRVALGQPRQEDLVNHFLASLSESEIAKVQSELLINLSPISFLGKKPDRNINLV